MLFSFFIKCSITWTRNNLLKRFNVTDVEEFKKQLNFSAIFILCSALRIWSAFQIISDLITSKDGNLLGERREASDPQVVKLHFSNPDLIYADSHPLPRNGPLGFTIALKAIIKESFGIEMEYEMAGKPTKLTQLFA